MPFAGPADAAQKYAAPQANLYLIDLTVAVRINGEGKVSGKNGARGLPRPHRSGRKKRGALDGFLDRVETTETHSAGPRHYGEISGLIQSDPGHDNGSWTPRCQ